MKYAVSIDWLALYVRYKWGKFNPTAVPTPELSGMMGWGYKKAEHGTRQFKELWRVALDCEPFAEVQCAPHSSVLQGNCGIVKFDNRILYTPNLWALVHCFLDEHGIEVVNISRIDICADFNAFACYECRQFVEDFLNGVLRHKGRGIGAAYFNHYAKRQGVYSQAVVKYTGLSFGSRESGVRVYLYNKTFELNSVKNKPYIRDLWKNAGLDTSQDVWRLEVSITGSGRSFKDKETGDEHEIDCSSIEHAPELVKIFHTFEKKYFAFIKNRPDIKNITREKLLPLFGSYEYYAHGCCSNLSCSNRTDRILIKQLWQLSQTYRGYDLHSDSHLTQCLAESVAKSCDLEDWLRKKKTTWENPLKK